MAVADDGPWLVVGLGNPGAEYAATRHNVGAMVVDVLVARCGGKLSAHRRGRADVAEERLAGRRLILARPRSYMNESGGPVRALGDFYGVPAHRLLVIHDELDIPYGALRLKLGGGDNGHNGLRSVRSSLGSGDFHRLRVGVGRPPGRQDPAEFVLKPFSAVERRELPLILDRAADAVDQLLRDGLAVTQNSVHSDPA
ncbi:MAG: aminoacyl-tRNA hydrolase [Actinomycetota bacterium]|nr:MAG: aminoacyl-tRNA hydrolase [Actinomycetota bacterium]